MAARLQGLVQGGDKAEIAANGQKYNIHLGPLNSKAQVTDLKTQLKRLNHSEPLVVYSYNK